jgi:hypothetical protein
LDSRIKGRTYRLREFENKLLKRTIGLKRDKIIGSWRKMYNGELHNL